MTDKVLSTGKLKGGGAQGGGKTGDNGPTGSSRSYPKGKGGMPHRTDFNPQKVKTTSYAVGGVNC